MLPQKRRFDHEAYYERHEKRLDGGGHRYKPRESSKHGQTNLSNTPESDLEEGEIVSINNDDDGFPRDLRDDSSSRKRPDWDNRPAETAARHRSPPKAPRADRERHAAAELKTRHSRSDAPPEKAADPEIELDLEGMAGVERDPARVLAERRKARQAILAKYSTGAGLTGPPSHLYSKPEGTPPHSTDGPPIGFSVPHQSLASPNAANISDSINEADSRGPSRSASPAVEGLAAFELEKGRESSPVSLTDHGVSAADYNPNTDRIRDERRQLEREGHIAVPSGVGAAAMAEAEVLDDMFGALDEPSEREKADDDSVHELLTDVVEDPAVLPVIDRSGGGQVDSYDDSDGYYRVILGELLDGGRYHVTANLGKGMFSNVVRARDTLNEGDKAKEVAIKMQRSQETMYKAGQKEASVLRRLNEADPNDKKHVIKLERTFEHRGHLCLVFESLSLNLREVVKRFGKDVGINLRAVRAYTHQMFLALSLLRKLDIIHADIKPDNILINQAKSQLKVCDLGSASDTTENAITPYLVSRFYRAPEIILGLPYDCSIDTWAIGCTLYELYTGKILFAGRNNNQMLLEHQELRGRFVGKSLKKASFADTHFDEAGNFLSQERNRLTGQEEIKRLVIPLKPSADLRSRLMPSSHLKRLSDDELKLLANFVDLLNRCLELDASKRITPKEALSVRR